VINYARFLRLAFPGALYHVTSRGNSRADIFLDDSNCQAFRDVLAMVCQRMRWLGYAYCLMTNHNHVVIETAEGNLAKGMRQLDGVCRQCFNHLHGPAQTCLATTLKAILRRQSGGQTSEGPAAGLAGRRESAP
jgi:REP element-mobilizing transposase RayT